jgi:hypothetical protein
MFGKNFNIWAEGRFRRVIDGPVLGACRDGVKRSGMVAALMFVILFAAIWAHAGEIEPRAYVNMPVEPSGIRTPWTI